MSELIRLQTCRSCGFHNVANGQMQCRANPPHVQAILAVTQTGPQVAGHVTSWPIIEADWWCGRYKPLIAMVTGQNERGAA